MSTWTSRALALAILTILTGCLAAPEVTRRAPEKVAVAGHSVIVAGPPGYCVDTAASKDTETGAFVLLGSCASIAGSAQVRAPRIPAVLTASVAPASAAAAVVSVDQLNAFFRSAPGRAALARDGRTASVDILNTRQRGDALYLHARDTSGNTLGSLAPEYWRGVFDLDGRLVTVSVLGFATKPLSDGASLATLDAFAARIRAENRALSARTSNPRLPG